MTGVCLIFIILSLQVPVKQGTPEDCNWKPGAGSVWGTVTSVVVKDDSSRIFLSHVSFIPEGGTTSYFLPNILLISDPIELYPGNQIYSAGFLSEIPKPSNPGEFNSFYYYAGKGVSYRMQADKTEIRKNTKDPVACFLLNCKKRMIQVYEAWLPPKEAGLLSAMFFGEKELLSGDIKRLYQQNGMGHLLAISGLHISLIGWGVYKGSLLLFQYKKAAAVLGMGSVVCYCLLTGFSVSSSRAVIMSLLSFTAILAGRTYDMLSAASFSAILILTAHPLEIRSSGFLLSYGSVLGVCLVYPCFLTVFRLEERKKGRLLPILQKLVKTFLFSISIQLVTFPVILSSFYEYPIYGIFLNLLVIPLMSVLAVLSVSAAIVGLFFLKGAGFFMGGILCILHFYEGAADFCSDLPASSLVLGKPGSAFMIFYYGILCAVMLCSYYWKKKKFFFLLLSLFFIPLRPQNPGLQAAFLDVGQGDGIYLETKDKIHILVDGGSSSKKQLGKYTLTPFLKSQGCAKLDYIFLSHLDEDHISGVVELLQDQESIKIGTIVLAKGIVRDEAFSELLKLAEHAGVKTVFIKREQSLAFGGLKIRCVNPSDADGHTDRNEASMALEIGYGEFNMLLTGDMEASEMEAAAFLEQKSYQVLKVGHHGSKSSSCEAFIKRVEPGISIISCAEKNRYSHPAKETVERLEHSCKRIYYTKTGGAVLLRTDGKKLGLDYFKDI